MKRHESSKSEAKDELRFSRRDFLEVGSGALAAVGVGSVVNLLAQDQSARPGPDRSTSDPGPANPALDAQNPAASNPPATDAGGVPSFKYPFSFSHKRLHGGRLVARGHRARTSRLTKHGWRGHEAHGRRRP